jgi:hypothetical protein
MTPSTGYEPGPDRVPALNAELRDPTFCATASRMDYPKQLQTTNGYDTMKRILMLAALLGACSRSEPAVPPVDPAEPEPKATATTKSPAKPAKPKADADAAAPTHTELRLHVHEARVECQGEAPMLCLQVRRSPDDDWELFYDPIEEFEHEGGYRYELDVEVSTVQRPPADAPSLKYRLVRIVAKQKPDH